MAVKDMVAIGLLWWLGLPVATVESWGGNVGCQVLVRPCSAHLLKRFGIAVPRLEGSGLCSNSLKGLQTSLANFPKKNERWTKLSMTQDDCKVLDFIRSI